MAADPILHTDIDFLSRLLDDVIREQCGDQASEIVDQIRQLAFDRRADIPKAEERLVSRIAELTLDEIRIATRALSLFFDLANLAEDCQRIRVLRQRERQDSPRPRAESVGAAIDRLKTEEFPAGEVESLLDKLFIELVFTAHPTEAKRRSVRSLLRQIRTSLKQLDADDLFPRERQSITDQILADMTVLWQIDFTRPHRPKVIEEVRRGLFFAEGLWEVVPQIQRDLRNSLAANYPEIKPRGWRFLQFGTWIGGDRDGNPFVTWQTTEQALEMLQEAAVERHLVRCRSLLRLMSMSGRRVSVSPDLELAVVAAYEKWPDVRSRLDTIAQPETYRRWLKVIEYRLEHTLTHDGNDSEYMSAAELERDVRMFADSVAAHGQRIVARYLDEWLDQVRTFGLHLATMDIRQDSRVHVDVLTEVLRHARITDDYAALDEQARQQILDEAPARLKRLRVDHFSEQTAETLSLFRLLAETVQRRGIEVFGGHVISMTHHPSDVLAVLCLWKWAWKSVAGSGAALPPLPIVPLFETIDDLERAADILEALLANPTYAEYVQHNCGRRQMIMVGYSDSTKDGGYLAASWQLHQAQVRIAEVAEKYGVRPILFHGRGGALGRGGGPAARAILSLPSKAVNGALRVTEQGEVLAERYDDVQIAYRHLEQVTWATILVSEHGDEEIPEEWVSALERLADLSEACYRQLINHEGFLQYFDQATPIDEIERLPIGSRPSRRRERRSLADLRAIPWTFAWTQSRQFITAWFGVGTAVRQYLEDQPDGRHVLQSMYEKWMLFRAIIDNADLALAKADINIAHRYSQLVDDSDVGEAIWQIIAEEFAASREAVLSITQQRDLLAGIPWLRRSIHSRNPYVDPLNLIQIELMKRFRAASGDGKGEDAQPLREVLNMTIQGVASGLRTTG